MILTKWVEFEKEVELSITPEEAVQAITAHPECMSLDTALRRIVNDFGGFIKKVPDSCIAELPEKAREVIARFFLEQAQRFELGKSGGR